MQKRNRIYLEYNAKEIFSDVSDMVKEFNSEKKVVKQEYRTLLAEIDH
jgi:hypothetical protein